MKKNISLSSGILFLAAILISGGCNPRGNGQNNDGIKEATVTIHLKAVIKDGKKRLKLSDSNGNIAIDHLITEVPAGGTIIWMLSDSSDIDKIVKIYNPKVFKKIFKKEAKDQGNNIFKLVVPEKIPSGTMEKYNIKYIYKDGSSPEIDPYIRIEP